MSGSDGDAFQFLDQVSNVIFVFSETCCLHNLILRLRHLGCLDAHACTYFGGGFYPVKGMHHVEKIGHRIAMWWFFRIINFLTKKVKIKGLSS
ncbi:hypothetical protein BKM15_16395 [Pseudomonas syringae pv. syringae]|nr:hypothetical protein BKM15_16395 [Pseudomonas syringae pv. syringae]